MAAAGLFTDMSDLKGNVGNECAADDVSATSFICSGFLFQCGETHRLLDVTCFSCFLC